MTWRPQTFISEAEKAGVKKELINNAVDAATYLHSKSANVPVILTLKHLGHLTGSSFPFLRRVVERTGEQPYRSFRIRKRPLGGNEKRFRLIVVPDPELMTVQRWINKKILNRISPHHASTAFTSGSSIKDSAAYHCGCRWLIKVDIRNFFESITERQVYRVFESIGYQPLVSFELARLSTRLGSVSYRARHRRFQSNNRYNAMSIGDYNFHIMGHLPQGAPTSPKLANLAVRGLDEALWAFTRKKDIRYNRYADDLAFSIHHDTFGRHQISKLIGQIYKIIADNGLTPNLAKTSVSPPGARKILLGLNVDGETPKLGRKFKAKLRQHLHFLESANYGAAAHSQHLNSTIYGLRNHLDGKITYAEFIEPDYGKRMRHKFSLINWNK